jgi:uncharacterized protein
MNCRRVGAFFVLLIVTIFFFADGAYPETLGGVAAAFEEGRAGKVRLTVGEHPLWVEIAADPVARARGLKNRHALPPDEGMLFVFDSPEILTFWMQSTPLPLDIAFIGPDRRIMNILSMEPLDDVPRYRSSGPAQYALEVNRGWFTKHHLKPGDKIGF